MQKHFFHSFTTAHGLPTSGVCECVSCNYLLSAVLVTLGSCGISRCEEPLLHMAVKIVILMHLRDIIALVCCVSITVTTFPVDEIA